MEGLQSSIPDRPAKEIQMPPDQKHRLSNGEEDPPKHNDHHPVPAPATTLHTSTIVDNLLRHRFSCRYFQPNKIPDLQTLTSIFESARHAPSGSNFQPWKIHVFRNETKAYVATKVQTAFSTEASAHHSPYYFYPSTSSLQEPTYTHLLQWRADFGRDFYGPLSTDRSDVEARSQVTTCNWTFFDALIGLIITTTDIAATGSYLDVGFFVMSRCMSARAHGLGGLCARVACDVLRGSWGWMGVMSMWCVASRLGMRIWRG
jgi:hypothetical protein